MVTPPSEWIRLSFTAGLTGGNLTVVHVDIKDTLVYDLTVFYFTGNPLSCGGELTLPSGSFQSPQYPANYQNNLNCIWVIRTWNSFQINLTFTNIE